VHKYFKIILLGLLFLGPTSIAQTTNEQVKVFDVIYAPGNATVRVKVIGEPATLDKFFLVNLIGRKLKEKSYTKGQEYVDFNELTEITSGIYIVVAKDKNGKVMGTAKFNFVR
jgi:hypothetical protein